VAWAALGLAGVGVLAVVVPGVVAGVRGHPYFAVREILVRGATRVTAGEIRARAGIAPGMSIWTVDEERSEAALRAHSWLRAAQVRREPPGRVVIRVREERPAVIVALRGEEPALFYVSARGRLLAPVAESDPHDFPFVTGLTRAALSAGEAAARQALTDALTLVRVAGATPGLEAVSEVHLDRTRGPSLLLVRPAVPIEVGRDGYATKLARLPRVLARWRGREAEMAGVSLAFEGDVIVRTRARRTT
jgi:hypothetical protein